MIKRATIILTLFILTCSTISAAPGFGFRLGAGHYNMRGIEEGNREANGRWGGTFGFFMTQNLGGIFLLQPMIILIWRNFMKTHLYQPQIQESAFGKITLQDETHEMSESVSLGYVQIPLLIRYDIPVQGPITPRVLLGPSFAFNISAKDKASGFGDWDGEHDIGNVKTLDISGIIGLGVSVPVGKFTVGLDLMYDRSFGSSFSNVTEEELANDVNEELWTKTDPVTFERTTEAVDFKNNGFSFQVGMVLPLGAVK